MRLITNVAQGLQTDGESKYLLQAWRGYMRTIWDGLNDPPASEGRRPDDDATRAEIQAMRDEAEGRQARGPCKRGLQNARKQIQHVKHSLAVLQEAIPSGSVVLAAPPASGASRRAPMSTTHCPKAEIERMMDIVRNPPPEPAPPTSEPAPVPDVTAATRTSDEDNIRLNLLRAFDMVTTEEYLQQHREWEAGGKKGHPPLNVEQRAALRPAKEYALLRHAWMQRARAAIQQDVRPEPPPKAPLIAVHAEPGGGKSVMLNVWTDYVQEVSTGALCNVNGSFMGVAASLVPLGRTLHNLWGLSVPMAASNEKLVPLNDPSSGRGAALAELNRLWNPLCTDEGCVASVCFSNDEMSQTTANMLAHFDQRMREVQPLEWQHLPFGGHCVLLVGDFYQLPPCGGTSLYSAMMTRWIYMPAESPFSKKGKEWAKLFAVDSAATRGTDMLRLFKMVSLGPQMRSQHDEDHRQMIRTFRDIHDDNPYPLLLEYLSSLKTLTRADVEADPAWALAPIAVVGNHERHVLTPVRARDFARTHGQPLIKWRLDIIAGTDKTPDNVEAAAMSTADLRQMYEEEPGLWEYFVVGAPASLLVNYSVPRGLANGTPIVYHSFGYFDRDIHAAALARVNAAAAGEDVVLDRTPDYFFVEVSTDKGSSDLRVVLPYHRASMNPTQLVRKTPMRGETAIRHGILNLNVYKHAADLAFVATDYKFQGRGEDHLLLSLVNAGCMPSLTVQGLYVLLTRSRRGREGMRLLLPRGTRPEDALKYLLTMKRPKDLVLYLRGFDETGYWCPERSKAALAAMNEVEATQAAVAAAARRTSRQATAATAATARRASRKAAAATATTAAVARRASHQAAASTAAATQIHNRQATGARGANHGGGGRASAATNVSGPQRSVEARQSVTAKAAATGSELPAPPTFGRLSWQQKLPYLGRASEEVDVSIDGSCMYYAVLFGMGLITPEQAHLGMKSLYVRTQVLDLRDQVAKVLRDPSRNKSIVGAIHDAFDNNLAQMEIDTAIYEALEERKFQGMEHVRALAVHLKRDIWIVVKTLKGFQDVLIVCRADPNDLRSGAHFLGDDPSCYGVEPVTFYKGRTKADLVEFINALSPEDLSKLHRSDIVILYNGIDHFTATRPLHNEHLERRPLAAVASGQGAEARGGGPGRGSATVDVSGRKRPRETTPPPVRAAPQAADMYTSIRTTNDPYWHKLICMLASSDGGSDIDEAVRSRNAPLTPLY